MGDITTADKISRELDLIRFLFELQLSVKHDSRVRPIAFDGDGNPTPGRFMPNFMVHSEVELFNVQAFKDEFTTRFETATNHALIINQSAAIKQKAADILGYIAWHWDIDNPKVKDCNEWRSRTGGYDKYLGDILIYGSLTVGGVFYERHQDLTTIARNPNAYKFHHLTTNDELRAVCQGIVDFINILTPMDLTKPNIQTTSTIQEGPVEVDKIQFEVMIADINSNCRSIDYVKRCLDKTFNKQLGAIRTLGLATDEKPTEEIEQYEEFQMPGKGGEITTWWSKKPLKNPSLASKVFPYFKFMLENVSDYYCSRDSINEIKSPADKIVAEWIAEKAKEYADPIAPQSPQASTSTNEVDADEGVDYENAIESLSAYLSGVSASDFKHIVEHKKLQTGASKVKWIGNRVNAWRFQKYLSWSVKIFNSIFEMHDNNPLRANDKDKKGITDNPGVCKTLKELSLGS